MSRACGWEIESGFNTALKRVFELDRVDAFTHLIELFHIYITIEVPVALGKRAEE